MKLKLYIVYRKLVKAIRGLFFRIELSRRGDYTIRDGHELNMLMKERAYLDDAEVPVLAKYARQSDTIVEIGAAYGGSAALLLTSKKPNAKVHSIDPFIQDSMGPLQANKEACIKNVRRVLRATKNEAVYDSWVLHDGFSYDVVKTWDLPIDMLFIDGDHNYEAVKQDYEDWFKHMKTGGIILFHDSRKEDGTPPETHNKGWEGPTRLAKELRQDKRVQLVEEAYSLTAWKKLA